MKRIHLFLLAAHTALLQGFDFNFKQFETYGVLPEKHITVIIPMYMNKKYVSFCLDSVFMQRYKNCNFIIIDDASSDNTAELIYAAIKRYNKEECTRVIINKNRKGALYNLYHAIWSCADDDIIVTVDGDDRLFDNAVLKKINAVYQSPDVWLTHGYFLEFPDEVNNWSKPVPPDVIRKNTYRKHTPHPSHLRTFYAKLFKLIDKKDLMYKGAFYPMTWDQAFMFPMIEMAAERHYYFSEKTVLYLYNRQTPINDNKVNAALQKQLEKIIRAQKPYKRIEGSLWDYETNAYRKQVCGKQN